MLVRLITLSLCLVVLSACSNIQNIKTQEKLTRLSDSLDRYAAAIRWARYQDAYDYHVGPEGQRPQINVDDFKGISVTGYQDVEKLINVEQTEVTVVSIISYFNKNSATVNEYKHIQTWWYNDDFKRWLLDADFPQFK